jgi:hypothetical protein
MFPTSDSIDIPPQSLPTKFCVAQVDPDYFGAIEISQDNMALISIANNASMFKAAITSELNNSFLVQQSIFFL